MCVLNCVECTYTRCSKAFDGQMDGIFVDTVVRLLLDPYEKYVAFFTKCLSLAYFHKRCHIRQVFLRISQRAKSALNKFRVKFENFMSEHLRERLFSLSSNLRYEASVSSDLSNMVKEVS